jgi:hypothetical protein
MSEFDSTNDMAEALAGQRSAVEQRRRALDAQAADQQDQQADQSEPKSLVAQIDEQVEAMESAIAAANLNGLPFIGMQPALLSRIVGILQRARADVDTLDWMDANTTWAVGEVDDGEDVVAVPWNQERLPVLLRFEGKAPAKIAHRYASPDPDDLPLRDIVRLCRESREAEALTLHEPRPST